MQNLKLTDTTTIETLSGSSLNSIIIKADSFAVLGNIADALKKKENLDCVQFLTDDKVTGEYHDLILGSPLFNSVDYCIIDNAKYITAKISLREKTEIEKRLDALETNHESLANGQSIQDGAINDLGTVVSSLTEGGTV